MGRKGEPRIVVIGGGVGGLTAAASLASTGLDVTVLEAHVYAGGCAGTFYHQGYRFDAGATLPSGFYRGGPMDAVGRAVGIDAWPVQNYRSVRPAMVVHLPDGASVMRYTNDTRWEERRRAFGPESGRFWRWQEATSDALWDLAMRVPPWPPQTRGEVGRLAGHALAWLGRDARRRLKPGLFLDALQPVSTHLQGASERLRLFVDAQLLIASQATSRNSNALYGAAALDLPRRGVVHTEGGMGAIAATLVDAVRRNGGRVHFRHQATRVTIEGGRPTSVEVRAGRARESFPADIVIVNLPPWNVLQLLGEQAPRRLRNLPEKPEGVWGAFVVYAGLDGSAVPKGFPLHHQVVVGEPFGNGNTVFLSLSPAWDETRAPAGQRALTVSTHTDLESWWSVIEYDRAALGGRSFDPLRKNLGAAYQARKREYTDRVLTAAERVLPGLRDAASLVLPGTPVTYQRFTRRAWGWVGGFPQTSLLRAWGPRQAPGIWMVGDSVFPGQSVPAVALGGLRVAESVAAELGVEVSSAQQAPVHGPGAAQRRAVEDLKSPEFEYGGDV